LGKEHTVLLSTHILSEVEASCTRVVVIARGKLVAAGTMEDLAKRRRPAGLVVVVRGSSEAALAALRGTAGIGKAALEGDPIAEDVREIRCTWAKKVDDAGVAKATEDAVATLVGAGCFVREVRPVKSSLEEVFAELTRGEA